VCIAGLFPKTFGLQVEKVGGVAFFQIKETEEKYEAVSDRGGPEHPSPGGLLSDPRSGDGTNGGSKQGAHGV